MTAMSLLLCVVAYAPAVEALNTADIHSWQATSSLPLAVATHTSVTYGDYVYEIGGQDSSGNILSTVNYAKFNANGTVGTWQATTSLPNPDGVQYASSVAYNGYIYELDGLNNSAILSTVYYAKVNTDGTLGSWQTTTALPEALFDATSVVNNGYVYEIGGNRGGSRSTTVYYAKANANGTLGSWQTTTALPQPTHYAMSVVSNGYVYEMGGTGSGVYYDTVYYAKMNADGTLGSWQATTSLPKGIILATATTVNNYIYVFGGTDGITVLTDVSYAKVNANGTIGPWQTSANPVPLPNGGAAASAAVQHNGYIYEVGGFNTSFAFLDSVNYVKVNFINSLALVGSNGADITVTTPDGSNIDCSQVATEASQDKPDDGYAYPLGLVKLCLTNTNATNNQVTMIFVTDLLPNQVVARDYNTQSGTYINIPGAQITETTYNGQHALQLVYTLSKGGPLDSTPELDSITDPVGLAVSATSVGSPNTGYGTPSESITPVLLFAAISLLFGLALRLRSQD